MEYIKKKYKDYKKEYKTLSTQIERLGNRIESKLIFIRDQNSELLDLQFDDRENFKNYLKILRIQEKLDLLKDLENKTKKTDKIIQLKLDL